MSDLGIDDVDSGVGSIVGHDVLLGNVRAHGMVAEHRCVSSCSILLTVMVALSFLSRVFPSLSGKVGWNNDL